MGIHKISSLIDTAEVRKAHALTGDDLAKKQVNDSALAKIIKGEDDRLLLVIGPCSSDNEKAVLDYAHRLSKLQEEVKDKIFIVMRVIRLNHAQMVMVIKDLFTNLIQKELLIL